MTTAVMLTIIWTLLFGSGVFCMFMTYTARAKKNSESSKTWNLAAIILFGVSLAVAIVENTIN